MIRALIIWLPLVLAGMLAGCGILEPYRIEVQQGNFLSQDMVAQLKPGMTKEQVRFVLGTPLVTDIFHAERWDYVYTLERRGVPRQQRHLAVFFQDGRLARLQGDGAAAEPAGRAVQ
jgi:outer membrane protein assembly factor BamE